MKVSARDVPGFLEKPPGSVAFFLLYGPDPMRTAIARQDFLKKHLGESAANEMRLTRMTGSELRSDPARLQDSMRSAGFFPGARGVFIEDATDQITPILQDATAAWQEGDAIVIATAGNLGKGSKLRKLAENAANAAALGLYPAPPSRFDVEKTLTAAGVSRTDRDAMEAIMALSTSLDPGDFRQLIEKISLYAMGRAELALQDVLACAPSTTEEHLDDIIHAAAEGRVEIIGPQLARLGAQGTNPTTLCIAATRHFRQLHVAASVPGGADQGIARLRPPVFGPRRDRLKRQIQGWGMTRLESALGILLETDLGLRSASAAPPMAVMERALIRLAMMSPMRQR